MRMGVKTNPDTMKTFKSPDALTRQGNAGSTKGTKLPKGGCARGRKMGKRRKGY